MIHDARFARSEERLRPMGRLTDDLTRLVGGIRTARDDRRRLMRDIKHATAEMKRAVARLRSSFAADLSGARVAWLGAMVPVLMRGAATPGIAAPGVERKDSPLEPAEERGRLKANRDAEERAKRDAEDRARRHAEARARHGKAKRDKEARAKRRARKAKRGPR